MVGLRGFARGIRTEPAKVRRQEVWQAWMEVWGGAGSELGAARGEKGAK